MRLTQVGTIYSINARGVRFMIAWWRKFQRRNRIVKLESKIKGLREEGLILIKRRGRINPRRCGKSSEFLSLVTEIRSISDSIEFLDAEISELRTRV